MPKVKLASPAKINLALDILGKDPKTNLHFMQTIYHEIPLHDEIILKEVTEGIFIDWKPIYHNLVNQNIGARILINQNEFLLDEHAFPEPYKKENLAYKAARLIQYTFHIKKGVHITIKKNIPLRSGLGGGSSNAAAVLKGLNKLWNLNLNNDNLRKLAEKLGMDVPFFIEGGTAFGTHFGEKIEKLPHIDLDIRLYHIGIEITSEEAYKGIDLQMCGENSNKTKQLLEYLRQKLASEAEKSTILILRARHFQKLLSQDLLHNDFEPWIIKKHPEITDIYNVLRQKGAKHAGITGSGGMIFAVF